MPRSSTSAGVEVGPSWDWPSAALVVLLIQVAAARLVMTNWTSFLFFTQTLAALGTGLGLALAYSKFGRRTVAWLALAYSSVLIPWQLTGAVEVEASFGEKLASLGGQLSSTFGQFLARQPVDDAILFVAFVGLGFWCMGLSAGYYFARHRAYLAAVIPAGAVMLILEAYDYFVPVRIWALGIYVFLALLLLGRMYFSQNQAVWDQRRVFVTFEARRDLMNSLVAVSAISVLAAWSLPTSLSNIQSAAQMWSRITRPMRERFSNAVSALESPYGGGGRGDFYGDSLRLGRNASLGDTPVFIVRAEDAELDVPPRYYWRGRVYDYYANGQWSTVSARRSNFSPSADELSWPATKFKREEVRFTVTLRLTQQALLYAPAEPFWVNQAGSVLTTQTPDQGQDLAAWEAEPALSAGDSYEVRVRIANPTVEDLRGAGTEYPQWVSARYLQVPQDILPEVKDLAEEITKDQASPYDKAQAITFYLRQEIEYSTSLPLPPQDRDPVLWVLFDSKRGFCLYYASAEIIMLRSLGIPARMAAGFAQGEANADGEYVVRKVDAHAWPEVYFPGIGWVEFEPTGSQDPLRRPLRAPADSVSGNPSNLLPGLGLDEAGADVSRDGRVDETGPLNPLPFAQTPFGRAVWIGSLVLLSAVLLFLNSHYRWLQRLPDYLVESYTRGAAPPPAWMSRWARWNKLTSIERSFHAINLSLRWLGKPQAIHVTPIGRAQILRRLLPSALAPIDILLNEHQSSMFTPRPGNPARARQAAISILSKTMQSRLRTLAGFRSGSSIYPDRKP